MKRRILWVFILLGIFFLGFILTFSASFTKMEDVVFRFINPHRNINPYFLFFTKIGEWSVLVGVAAVLLLIPKIRWPVGVPAAVSVLISRLLNSGIKHLIMRERPSERLIEIGGYSFPSGHAMNSAALYVAIMLALLPFCKTRSQKAVVIGVCLALPLIIGISRVFFQVHYPTDVISGWCLGAVIAIICCTVFLNLTSKKVKKE